MNFENIVIVIFLSFFSLIIINFISRKLLLFDYPTNHKNHKMPTPYTGGIALIILFFFLIKFLNNHELFEVVLTYSFLIIIVGFFDDFINLNPGPKLFFLCLPIILLIYQYELIVTDIGEYKYFGNLVFIKFGIIFTILSGVGKISISVCMSLRMRPLSRPVIVPSGTWRPYSMD